MALYAKGIGGIGRAHNHDSIVTLESGLKGEFDDQGPDRPSCYSGVRRRLFKECVLGHKLFEVFDKDFINRHEEDAAPHLDLCQNLLQPNRTKSLFMELYSVADLGTLLANAINKKQLEVADYIAAFKPKI